MSGKAKPSRPRTRLQPGFLRQRQLLKWAIGYVASVNQVAIFSFRNGRTGQIDDPAERREIEDARRWLRRARAAVK